MGWRITLVKFEMVLITYYIFLIDAIYLAMEQKLMYLVFDFSH